VSGAAVLDDRLYVAVQPSGSLEQLYSLDLATGQRVLEAEQRIAGESEGLAAFPSLGGTLHWLIAPGAGASTPTYGRFNSVLLHFVRVGEEPPGDFQRLSAIRLRVTPKHPRAGRKVTLHLRAAATVTGRRVPADLATVRAVGRTTTLDAAGKGTLRVKAPRFGRLTVRATRPAMRAATVRLRTSR
jgi:hypothetical protein